MHQQSSSPLPEGRRGGEKKTKQEKNKTTKALRRENKKQIKKQKGGKKKSIFYIKKTLLLLSPWSSSIFLCLYIYTHICIYIYMYINLYIFSPCPWRGERGLWLLDVPSLDGCTEQQVGRPNPTAVRSWYQSELTNRSLSDLQSVFFLFFCIPPTDATLRRRAHL